MSTRDGGAPDKRRRQSLLLPQLRITTNSPQLNGQQDVITDSQSTYHPENTSGPYPQSDPSAQYSPQLNVLNTNAFDGTDGAGQIDPTAYPQAFHGLEWSVLLGCYVQSTNAEAPTQQEETMNTGWSLDAPDWRDHNDFVFPPSSPFTQSLTLHSPLADSAAGSSSHSSSAMSTSFADSPFPISSGSSVLGYYDARRSSADFESSASRRRMEAFSNAFSSRSTITGPPMSAPPHVNAFPSSYDASTSDNEWLEASTSAHALFPQASPTGMDYYPPGSVSPSLFDSSSPRSGMPSSSGSSSHPYLLPELEGEVSRRHSYGSSDHTSLRPPSQSTHRHSYSDDPNYASTSRVYGSSGPELRPTHQHSYSDGPAYATTSQPSSAVPTGWQSIPMDIASGLPTDSPYYHPPDPNSSTQFRLPSRTYKHDRKRGPYKKSVDGIKRTRSQEYRYNVENAEFDILTGNPDEQGSPRPKRRKRGEGTKGKGGVGKVACKACSARHYRCEQDEGGARCERCIFDDIECVYVERVGKGKGGSTKGNGKGK